MSNVVDDKTDGYLATPDGSVLLLDYEKQSSDASGWDERVIDEITTEIPSDPNDPHRKNSISPKANAIEATKALPKVLELLKKGSSQ